MLKELEVVIINFSFDINGQYEIPTMILANPDKTELSLIMNVKDLVITPRFNSVSELSFMVYQRQNEIIMPYYDSIKKNKRIHVIGFGWFIIDSTSETNDGSVPSKTVNAFSAEYELNYKGINILDGTYKFYDPIRRDGTLLYELMKAAPGWRIGTVDTALLNLYRTFDVPDGNLYGFLQSDVSTSCECIFDFDIENFVINARVPQNVVKNTDIIFTFDNINKNITIEELSNDIVTVLRVNGADNLTITRVNPVGTNQLFNFDYYANTGWISNQALINKINNWKTQINNYKPSYTTNLANLKQYNKDLIILRSELVNLQNELTALEIVRKNLTDDPARFRELTHQVNAKNNQINAKNNQITSKQNQITSVQNALNNINNILAYSRYFTAAEQLQLDPYIVEAVYTDDSFIVTDQMEIDTGSNGDTLVLTTNGVKKIKDLLASDILVDDQYIANQLMEHGESVLATYSQPAFSFSLDATNFLFVEKFKPFINQVDLGALINVEIKENDWATPIILEMTIDYENPENFSMVFGNRFRMQTAEWSYADLHSEFQKTATSVGSTLSIAAMPVKSGFVNEVTEYLESNLNAAKQNIISTEDNEITLGEFGLRGRKKLANGTYDPRQLWINNNLICMTDNNWETVKLAIGYINGYYAVNAEIIAGNLIAGNQLIIQDGVKGQESTFIVDANGARLTNASFILTTRDGRGKIILNPTNGIRIQSNQGAGLRDVFYVDTAGKLMATSIYVTGGTTAGFNITDSRLYCNQQSITNRLTQTTGSAYSRYSSPVIDLNANGTGKLSLLSWNLDTARFDGSIYAQSGTIGGFVIESTRLYSTATSVYPGDASASPVIELNSIAGTGRLGFMRWDRNTARFDGTIYANSGNIGGWVINSSGIYGYNGDYIGSNGYGKLSGISWTPTSVNISGSATFRGTVYATDGEFSGTVYADDGYFYGDIYASGGEIGGFEITSSSIRSNNGRIVLNRNGSATLGALSISTNGTSTFGGRIEWPRGGTIYEASNGAIWIESGANNSIQTGRLNSLIISVGTLDVTDSFELRNRQYVDTSITVDGRTYRVLARGSD